MKILTASQIRDWDKASMKVSGISSLMLMERAAKACTDWLTARFAPDTPFLVICGTGNNGGDGFAMARQLTERGYSVVAFLVEHSKRMSPDCRANLEALKQGHASDVKVLQEGSFITDLPTSVVIIDALFGTGINRSPEGYAAEFIRRLNELPNSIVSIDMPSGLPADELPDAEAVIINATHTLTFQQYKRSLLHPGGGRFAGTVHVLDIGLDKEFQENAESSWHTLDASRVKDIYRPREAFSHKGTYGTAFIIGGSHGMIGAAVLATRAAGRAGAGKVRALLPCCGYEIVQTLAPDAMCVCNGEDFLEDISGWESATGIGIGPGIGRNAATVSALGRFLKKIDRPFVADADALNIPGEHPEWIRHLPRHSIITPHPKELERLFGKSDDSLRRAHLASSKAVELGIIIVAKDARTVVALPDGQSYYNLNGNAGMATGGSGDVLCGLITGLLAQGYSPEQAALMGVFLHGAAGDEAAKQQGVESMIAGDIVDALGTAFSGLRSRLPH